MRHGSGFRPRMHIGACRAPDDGEESHRLRPESKLVPERVAARAHCPANHVSPGRAATPALSLADRLPAAAWPENGAPEPKCLRAGRPEAAARWERPTSGKTSPRETVLCTKARPSRHW